MAKHPISGNKISSMHVMIGLGVLLIGIYIFVNVTHTKKEIITDKGVPNAMVSTSAEQTSNVDAVKTSVNQPAPVYVQADHVPVEAKIDNHLNALKALESKALNQNLNNDMGMAQSAEGGNAMSSVANAVPTPEQALKGVIAENKRRGLLNTAVSERKAKMDEVHQAILTYQAANAYKDNAPELIEKPKLTVPEDIAQKIKSHELAAH